MDDRSRLDVGTPPEVMRMAEGCEVSTGLVMRLHEKKISASDLIRLSRDSGLDLRCKLIGGCGCVAGAENAYLARFWDRLLRDRYFRRQSTGGTGFRRRYS